MLLDLLSLEGGTSVPNIIGKVVVSDIATGIVLASDGGSDPFMNTYEIGDLVRLTGSFANQNGTLTNPTTVTLMVRNPDGTTMMVSSLTNSSTGIFYSDYPVSESGLYYYRYAGAGAVTAAIEAQFQVAQSVVLDE